MKPNLSLDPGRPVQSSGFSVSEQELIALLPEILRERLAIEPGDRILSASLNTFRDPGFRTDDGRRLYGPVSETYELQIQRAYGFRVEYWRYDVGSVPQRVKVRGIPGIVRTARKAP
jgi:hypothetical protein